MAAALLPVVATGGSIMIIESMKTAKVQITGAAVTTM